MRSKLILLAGGTGCGKSTAAFALFDKYPDRICVIHLDDYHKKQTVVPKLFGMPNWDSPEAIDFSQLKKDLVQLFGGESIIIPTKNERDNPLYKKYTKQLSDSTEGRIGRLNKEFKPAEYIILEGYLVLHDRDVRKLASKKIYLSLPHEERMRRRTKFMDPVYEKKILIPMHNKYVEASKKFADLVVDVSEKSVEQVVEKCEKAIGII